MPPSNSQKDLSVGFPVKKRLKSDLIESASLIPSTISTIPTAKRANPNALFILFLLLWLTCFTANSDLMPALLEACHPKDEVGDWLQSAFQSRFAEKQQCPLAFCAGQARPGSVVLL